MPMRTAASRAILQVPCSSGKDQLAPRYRWPSPPMANTMVRPNATDWVGAVGAAERRAERVHGRPANTKSLSSKSAQRSS